MTVARKPVQHVDVCIIGAGPAGSALAIRLAQLGHDVCMIERATFPRSHVGESLSPGIWPQLELLGVARTVQAAGFWPCRTALVQWEGDVALRRDLGAASGLLVDRGRFDALLLDCARAHGVRVMQPAVVRARTCDDHGWHVDVQSADRGSRLDADFLADASGRSAVLRGRKERDAHRTLALYGYWRGGSLPQQPRIEAAHDVWYWGVPLPDGTYNAMVFLDAADLRAGHAASLSATYHGLIAQSALMADCRDVRLVGRVCAADATPYLDSHSIGPRSIKIGDAALALDPLSSSGVQKAINTALTGAVAVNTLLRRPAQADAATQFYTSNLAEASDRHRAWAAGYYAVAAASRPARFWQTRAAGAAGEPEPITPAAGVGSPLPEDAAVTLSPEAMVTPAPSLAGAARRLSRRLRGGRTAAAFAGGHGARRSDECLEYSQWIEAGDRRLAIQASRAEAIRNPGGLPWRRKSGLRRKPRVLRRKRRVPRRNPRARIGSISTATMRFTMSWTSP
jgi:flavin-dependent dehydrogenase